MTQNNNDGNQTQQATVSTTGTGSGDGTVQQSFTSDKVQMYGTSQTNDPTQQQVQASQPSAKTFTEDEVSEMISKARSDEKSKVFSKLGALKDEKTQAETRLKELESTLNKTQSDLDKVRKGKNSEMESITEELSTLRDTNKKLEAAIQTVADEAAARVRDSELRAYKEKQIRNSKVQLTELVVGATEEEIDASIKKALEREQSLKEEIRKNVHEELSATLPQPLAIDGQQGRGPAPSVTPENREAVARLRGDEYRKRRQQLLEEAKQKVGLP